jgi:hypothetical protein
MWIITNILINIINILVNMDNNKYLANVNNNKYFSKCG